MAELDALVKALIAENRKLAGRLEKLAAKKTTGGLGQVGKTIAAIRKRVQKALAPSSTPKRRTRRTTKASLPTDS